MHGSPVVAVGVFYGATNIFAPFAAVAPVAVESQPDKPSDDYRENQGIADNFFPKSTVHPRLALPISASLPVAFLSLGKL